MAGNFSLPPLIRLGIQQKKVLWKGGRKAREKKISCHLPFAHFPLHSLISHSGSVYDETNFLYFNRMTNFLRFFPSLSPHFPFLYYVEREIFSHESQQMTFSSSHVSFRLFDWQNSSFMWMEIWKIEKYQQNVWKHEGKISIVDWEREAFSGILWILKILGGL